MLLKDIHWSLKTRRLIALSAASQDLTLIDSGSTDNTTYFVFSRNVTVCDSQDFDFLVRSISGTPLARPVYDLRAHTGAGARQCCHLCLRG